MAAPTGSNPSPPPSNSLNARLQRQTAWFLAVYQRESLLPSNEQFLHQLVQHSSHDPRIFNTPLIFMRVPESLRRDTQSLQFSLKSYIDVLYLTQNSVYEENEQAKLLYDPSQIERVIGLTLKGNTLQRLSRGEFSLVEEKAVAEIQSAEVKEDPIVEQEKHVQAGLSSKLFSLLKNKVEEKKEEANKLPVKKEEADLEKKVATTSDKPLAEGVKKLNVVPAGFGTELSSPLPAKKKLNVLPRRNAPPAPIAPLAPTPASAPAPLIKKVKPKVPVHVPYTIKKFGKDILSYTLREIHHAALTNKHADSVLGGAFGFLAFLPSGLSSALAGMAAGAVAPVIIKSMVNRPEEPKNEVVMPPPPPPVEQPIEEDPRERRGSHPGVSLNNPITRRLGRNVGRNLLRKGAQMAGQRLATTAAAATSEVWGPVLLVIVAIVAVIILIFLFMYFFMDLEKSTALLPAERPADLIAIKDRLKKETEGGTTPASASGQLQVSKTGPAKIENGEIIKYQISVTYKGEGKANIEVLDPLPANTQPDELAGGTFEGNIIHWEIKDLEPNQAKTIDFSLKPILPDIKVTNMVEAKITGRSTPTKPVPNPGGGAFAGLLPNPLPAPARNWESIKAQILAAVNGSEIESYKQAEAITGTPWWVLVGLHYVETAGSLSPKTSLVSGRAIGVAEPDIARAKCTGGESGPGKPVPMGGGCGFTSFLDSAIYAGYHIQEKIGGVPKTFEEAVTALARYNGGGNRNCGRGVPYPGQCPPYFEGEDDPYPMADFDEIHSDTQMFTIYCYDGVKCSPPNPFKRPGAFGVIRALFEEGMN